MFDFSPGYTPPEPEPEPTPPKRRAPPGRPAGRHAERRRSRSRVFALAALAQLSPLLAVLAGIGWALIETI